MRILYATDGSQGALAAGRFLAGLPHHPNIHVHIVTARPADDPEDGSASLAEAEAALGGFPAHVTTATARVNHASTSEITDMLLCTADYAAADLIVVGASGHSAFAKFFLGSVAEAVARHARQPVLVARPLLTPLREVVIGFDGSDGARKAATYVNERFPLPLLCSLRIASVVPQPVFGAIGDPLYPGAPDYLALEMANQKARSKACREAAALAADLRKPEGGPTLDVAPVALGNPASELIRIAEENSAELIAVGSQGLTGTARFLLGSVSERVLRHAHCSVLIVK